ncbi:MAG TPA: hypothetical protein VFD18_02625, partial [Chthoniobacterales bacterium]|nr:hypothetical protein [Chthoniobacterales bacterium]
STASAKGTKTKRETPRAKKKKRPLVIIILIKRKQLEPIQASAQHETDARLRKIKVRAQRDQVNCASTVSPNVFSQSPLGIFRQDYFDSRMKIKFSFFLVPFAHGF